MTPLERLVAREAIHDLVLRYSNAIADRDVDVMVSLHAPDASFGAAGSGPDALRTLVADTMADLRFAVILVANHLVDFDDHDHAHGEVWARCYAQNDSDGYYEQLIKYVDRYRRVPLDGAEPEWRFQHRRHLLWFGEAKASPLAQEPADWPARQIGVGRLALGDDAVVDWRNRQAGTETT